MTHQDLEDIRRFVALAVRRNPLSRSDEDDAWLTSRIDWARDLPNVRGRLSTLRHEAVCIWRSHMRKQQEQQKRWRDDDEL